MDTKVDGASEDATNVHPPRLGLALVELVGRRIHRGVLRQNM